MCSGSFNGPLFLYGYAFFSVSILSLSDRNSKNFFGHPIKGGILYSSDLGLVACRFILLIVWVIPLSNRMMYVSLWYRK